jgi:hypothetical protein
MSSTITNNRDEMIQAGRLIANKLKELYEENPHKTHFIEINGDPCSGKSLVVDTVRSHLFGEEEIPKAKERIIAHYRGKIKNKPTTISMVNATTFTGSEVYTTLARATRQKGGFVFVLNQAKYRLGKIFNFWGAGKEPVAKVYVGYPDGTKQSFGFKYLGIKSLGPETSQRKISWALKQ